LIERKSEADEMTRGACLAILTCLLVGGIYADSPTIFQTVDPASVGIDVGTLEEFEQKLEADIAKGRIVGAMALIARGDKVAYSKTWGHRDRQQDLPMTEDTIHRIFSMTKPITTVAAMQLVEQNKIEIDAPVSKYLPSMKGMKVAETIDGKTEVVDAQREPTIRDLCRHTSGLSYGVWNDEAIMKTYYQKKGRDPYKSAAHLVELLSDAPLIYQPGTKWEYSYASDVLAEVVAVVSGERFDRYLKKHIFDPLKMEDTFFLIPSAKRDRLAVQYRPDGPDGLKPVPANPASSYFDPENRLYSGGAGLASTTNDYFRFCQAMLFGGELAGVRILKQETVAEMFSKQLDDSVQIDNKQLMKDGYNFGLGFAVTKDGMGWGGAAGTRFIVSPSRNLIAIYMTQIAPYQDRNYGEIFLAYVLAADKQTSNE
jgi:CubicO group peptidase (beta-lactamase class C family)